MACKAAFAFVQAEYHAALAQSVPFCYDPRATQARRDFVKLAGQTVCMMAVFCESLPEQFLASQSINMLDGTSRMPPQAFQQLAVSLC